jgi:hypothetical protein
MRRTIEAALATGLATTSMALPAAVQARVVTVEGSGGSIPVEAIDYPPSVVQKYSHWLAISADIYPKEIAWTSVMNLYDQKEVTVDRCVGQSRSESITTTYNPTIRYVEQNPSFLHVCKNGLITAAEKSGAQRVPYFNNLS